jgi:hypothetical protein
VSHPPSTRSARADGQGDTSPGPTTATAVLAERNDGWAEQRRSVSFEDLAKVDTIVVTEVVEREGSDAPSGQRSASRSARIRCWSHQHHAFGRDWEPGELIDQNRTYRPRARDR